MKDSPGIHDDRAPALRVLSLGAGVAATTGGSEMLWSDRPLGADHLFGGGW